MIPDAGASDIDVAALRRVVDRQVDDMLADLRAYVSLETPSDDRAALDAGLEWLLGWLDERLGSPATRLRHDGRERGETGDTVVVDYDGTTGTDGRLVTLLCHYDTVWPLGTLTEIPFSVDGDTIRGPGVFDMKAGLVQVVWALRALDAAGAPRPPVRLVVNGDEEIGSPFSRPIIEESCAGADAVLVFEASAGGAVKTSRKGVGLFDVTATGVEAHAGLDPTKGASAIDALARAVADMHALTDLDAGTTVNVGTITGGTRRNVTAGAAHAGVDVRVDRQGEADRVDRAMRTLSAADPRVTLHVEGGWNRPVMERTPEIGRLYGLARDLAARAGLTLEETSVGGASDGNFAAAMGLPVLDGFGAVGAGAHARDEHASVAGMAQRCALAAAVLSALAEPTTDGSPAAGSASRT